ncbi:MAG: SGNH/GDSL hydrolase family protein [Xanthomonadales bacterium]|jgi:lysophospholipase L1-like esterase|nr:SGNH/GDSL hydrolase family protein [Xanthomonadales bacterium]
MIGRLAYLSLLATQGLWASRRTPRLPPARGSTGGTVGAGVPLSLLAIGDSIIEGVGVTETRDALPARLALALSRRGAGEVRWQAVGRNGARSTWVLAQLGQLEGDPDLVVISNGINDVTTTRPEHAVLERLLAVVDAAGQRFPHALIVQLGLPPLGGFPALPQPLRRTLGRRADRIDEALGERVRHAARVLHLPFDQMPDPDQFASDGYHPDESGVAVWAESLAPRLLERLLP